jgi:phage baseplate assembly protein W
MATQLKKFYVGFNTRNYEEKGVGFTSYNVECVEQDILNAIFTVRGERVMMPNYGTRFLDSVLGPTLQGAQLMPVEYFCS